MSVIRTFAVTILLFLNTMAHAEDFSFAFEDRAPVRGDVRDVEFLSDSSRLVVVTTKEGILLTLSGGRLHDSGIVFRTNKEALAFASGPEGRSIAAVDAGGHLYLYDGKPGSTGTVVKAHSGKAVAVSFTGDGKYVITGGHKGDVKVWTPRGDFFAELGKGVRHNKGIVMIAGLSAGRQVISVGKDRRVILWDVDTQRAIRPTMVDMNVLSAAVSQSGNVLALGLELLQGNLFSTKVSPREFTTSVSPHEIKTRDTVRLIDAETGTRIRDLEGSRQELRTVGVTPDGRFVAAAGSGASASVWDAGTGKLITTIPFENPATALAFSRDGKWLVTGTRDGSVSLYSLSGVGPVVIPTKPGEIIVVVVEPEAAGRSSGGAVARVSTPSLRVRGRIKSTTPIKSLQVDGHDVTAISPTGDGDHLFTAYVRLADPGRHQVDVVVEDQAGTAVRESFVVERTAEIAPPSPGEGQRIALIVGVSEYAEPSIDLQYAANDAQALYKLLTSSELGPAAFRPENVKLLLNEEATVANVNIGIRQFLQRARENDFVLVFFAGHGMPDPNRLQDLYLIAHDTSPRDIAGTGILMRHVREGIAQIRARDVFVLVDSCHSAGVGAPKSIRNLAVNPIHQSFLNKLRHSSGGMTILTASEAAQYSLEDSKWRIPVGGETWEGHGVFTYYLLKGLLGEADDDRDRIVTVGEVVEYVRDHVRNETGGDQIPAVGLTSFDRELPISIVERR